MTLPRTKLPDITWTLIYARNPDRRWWQFWKPKIVITARGKKTLLGCDAVLHDLSWIPADK